MKIALVAYDVALPGEKGLGRMYYLAGLFQQYGYEAELITGTFQHWEKRFRTAEEMAREYPFRVVFLDRTAYTKNIEFRRIVSLRTLARALRRHLEANSYDLVYCLMPDNHIAAMAAKYAQKCGVPFIIDVEDLWPEAMRLVLDVPVVSDMLFSYFTVNARAAYRRADGVIGSSDTYRDEPKKYKVAVPRRETVYVGNDLAAFDTGAAANLARVEKPAGEFWVTYAGTLGASYDIGTLIRAADLMKKRGDASVRVMLLGDGPQKAELEALAAELCGNVTFLGYQPYPVMAAYLRRSDVTVNSLGAKAAQSIVTKIGDYLAAGKPMINTGLDPEFRAKVVTDGFGVNVPPGDDAALADAIAALRGDPSAAAVMGARGRRIAEEQFDRPVSYRKIIAMADGLLGVERTW